MACGRGEAKGEGSRAAAKKTHKEQWHDRNMPSSWLATTGPASLRVTGAALRGQTYDAYRKCRLLSVSGCCSSHFVYAWTRMPLRLRLRLRLQLRLQRKYVRTQAQGEGRESVGEEHRWECQVRWPGFKCKLISCFCTWLARHWVMIFGLVSFGVNTRGTWLPALSNILWVCGAYPELDVSNSPRFDRSTRSSGLAKKATCPSDNERAIDQSIYDLEGDLWKGWNSLDWEMGTLTDNSYCFARSPGLGLSHVLH